MANHRKWLGYIVFAVILSVFFLYFCFPSEAICKYLRGAAARFSPTLALSVENIRPAFPFALRLEDTDVSVKGRPDSPVFRADSLVIMPSARVLTLRKPAFRFDCEGVYGGKIQGVIAFKTFNLQGPFQSNMEIRSVQLGKYPCLSEWLNLDLTGVISGTVVYDCNRGDFLHGSGESELSILDSTVQLAQPFLGMEFFHFDRIDARMVLDNQRVSLDRCEFTGEQLQGKASGTIVLDVSIAESNLDLTVTLEEFSALVDDPGVSDVVRFFGQGARGGHLTINIGGTVAQPRISFT
jgi:type II secretion system protein N